MYPFSSVLITCLFLFSFNSLSAADPPVVQSVDSVYVAESEVYNLEYRVDTALFEGLLRQYDQDGMDENRIGGFVFIPKGFSNLTASKAGGNTGKNSTAPLTYANRGYQVFLAYYEETDDGNREIKFYGLPEFIEAFTINNSLSSSNSPTDQFFNLDNGVQTPFSVTDNQLIREVPEMDLSYLTIEDYYYLAREKSFYSNPEQAAKQRHIIVQRAIVNQVFDIADSTRNRFQQYRTLSFRPYPYPDISQYGESVMAFKYGYYCPPYWRPDPDNDDPDEDDSEAPENQALFFFSQPPLPPSPPINKAEAISNALNSILKDQLMQRRMTIRQFQPDKPTSSFRDRVLKNAPWIILILLIGILIGWLLFRNQVSEPSPE